MPEISVAVPHSLGQEEATERLKGRSSLLKDTFSGKFDDLEESWDGHVAKFALQTYGVKIQGSLTSDPSEVTVKLNLPLMAMMFKGTIETQIKEHLGKVLA